VTGGDNVTVVGSGTVANPYIVAAHTDCAEARACLAAGNGLAYNPATGVFSAVADPAAGNALVSSPTGLYVPANATVAVACGLTGNGSSGSPLAAKTLPWTFPGTPAATGSLVACDVNGNLRGEPPYHSYYFQLRRTNTFAVGALAVPAGAILTNVDVSLDLVVTNPDASRSMRVMWKQESRTYVNLPSNSTATTGVNSEEYWSGANNGATALGRMGVYTDKLNEATSSLAPGASTTLSMQAQACRGTGSASIIEIHMSHRVWLMPS
jgi:hypothetical protein